MAPQVPRRAFCEVAVTDGHSDEAVARASDAKTRSPEGVAIGRQGGLGLVSPVIVAHLHCVNVDSLTRAFIRGAALAVTLSACGETAPAQKLDPIPARTYPHCVGPDFNDDFGLHGRCCGDVQCTDTVAGLCPELGSGDLSGIVFPPGSGECGCESDEGPFARSDAPDIEDGACCYVIYSIGCDGRPLRRDGAVVVAEVVARADWMGAAELPTWS